MSSAVYAGIYDVIHAPHSKEAKLLEEESIAVLKHVPEANDISTRTLGNSLVYLLYENDQIVYDEVLKYKKDHEHSTLEEALTAFGKF
jgi:hypothetical protein